MDEAPERVVDPGLAICDAHHHLGKRGPYSYSAEELELDLAAGHNVVSTVYIEWGFGQRTTGPEHLRPVGEYERVIAQRLPPGVADGVVVGVDLRAGAGVSEVLEAYREVDVDRLKGVRFSTAWDPRLENHGRTPHMLDDPAIRAGVATLGRYLLPMDCWLYGGQLEDLGSLASAFPEQVFVLDHLGTPLLGDPYRDRRDEVLDDWKRGMTSLAIRPNVVVKIGGLLMPLLGGPWSAAAPPSARDVVVHWGSEVHWCIDTFGPTRCMFESNFPVDRLVMDYRSLWNAYKELAAPYSESERRQLFHTTAADTYGLTRHDG